MVTLVLLCDIDTIQRIESETGLDKSIMA